MSERPAWLTDEVLRRAVGEANTLEQVPAGNIGNINYTRHLTLNERMERALLSVVPRILASDDAFREGREFERGWIRTRIEALDVNQYSDAARPRVAEFKRRVLSLVEERY